MKPKINDLTYKDLAVKLDKKDIWLILYLLNSLEDTSRIKSKYIARILQKSSQEIVGQLKTLHKLGLVKQFFPLARNFYSNKFPVSYWHIRKNGQELIKEREKLDNQNHHETLNRLNSFASCGSINFTMKLITNTIDLEDQGFTTDS